MLWNLNMYCIWDVTWVENEKATNGQKIAKSSGNI